jgi:glycosyltransferase involved in cell wall biosynthesis
VTAGAHYVQFMPHSSEFMPGGSPTFHSESTAIVVSSPKSSIIIPCYNREKYIRDSIDSALAQQYENKEIIVIDDGSTDTSRTIIESYANKVKAIFTENYGISAARNTAIGHARGEYIAFLDSDDKLAPECLNSFFDGPFDLNRVLVGRCNTIDMHGYLTDLNTYDVSDCPSHGKFSNLQVVAEFAQNWGCLIPRQLLMQIGGYNETISLGEDYDVNLRLLDAGAEFRPIYPYVYQARIHHDSRLSNNFSAERYHRVAELFERAWIRWKEQFWLPENQKWRVIFARRVWSTGRIAYRARERDCGNRFTRIAFEIAGRRAWVGSLTMRTLYQMLPPYEAELASEGLKFVLGEHRIIK